MIKSDESRVKKSKIKCNARGFLREIKSSGFNKTEPISRFSYEILWIRPVLNIGGIRPLWAKVRYN